MKRGGLVAAANWPIVFIQASADALLKLVIAVPFSAAQLRVLVALIVGAEPGALLGLDVRDLAATILALLLARPLALTSFAAAMAVAVVGASVFIFLLKGDAGELLVRAERDAGAVEEPPLQFSVVATGAAFTVERFIEGCRELFPRFLRLGFVLMAAYALSGLGLVMIAFGREGPTDGSCRWRGDRVLRRLDHGDQSAVSVAQIVMAAEDAASVWPFAARGRIRPPRASTLAAVCLATLGLVRLATFASLVAATALGLIGFVPFVGLAVLPLQLLALVLRSLVLQVIRAGVGRRLLGAVSRAVVREHRAGRFTGCSRRARGGGVVPCRRVTSNAFSRRWGATCMGPRSGAWARWSRAVRTSSHSRPAIRPPSSFRSMNCG